MRFHCLVPKRLHRQKCPKADGSAKHFFVAHYLIQFGCNKTSRQNKSSSLCRALFLAAKYVCFSAPNPWLGCNLWSKLLARLGQKICSKIFISCRDEAHGLSQSRGTLLQNCVLLSTPSVWEYAQARKRQMAGNKSSLLSSQPANHLEGDTRGVCGFPTRRDTGDRLRRVPARQDLPAPGWCMAGLGDDPGHGLCQAVRCLSCRGMAHWHHYTGFAGIIGMTGCSVLQGSLLARCPKAVSTDRAGA